MKTTFTKKGIRITVELKGTKLEATANNVTAEVTTVYPNRTWAYKMDKKFNEMFGLEKNKVLYLADESAKEMAKAKEIAIEEVENNEKEEIINSNNLIDVTISGDWDNDYMVFGKEAELLDELGLIYNGHYMAKEARKALGSEFTYQQAKEYADTVNKKEEEKREQEKVAEEKEIAEKFLEAKKTGKEVIIRRYNAPCNDKKEACEVDNIIIWAMPDGSEKETRNHTW